MLAEIKPERSISEIVSAVKQESNKKFSRTWMWELLNDMCSLKVIEKVLDEPKALRFQRTKKGEKIIKAGSLDDLRR